jgi:hypothetical protein
MCQVSGGVTGFRQALLKDGDSNRPRQFETREEAEAMVEQLSQPAYCAHSGADFKYWVVGA